MTILHTIGAVFIFAPFIAFLLIFALLRKRFRRRAFGLSADLTTFLLFFSVPVSIEALWGYSLSSIVYFIAIIIAIILLVLEWKKSKEIEVIKYIRKTWRMYFLILSLAYFIIWIAGISYTVIAFL